MARTLIEILTSQLEAKNSKVSLAEVLADPESAQQVIDDIESGSKVSMWLLDNVMSAVAIKGIEEEHDAFELKINSALDARIAPNLLWYQKIAFEFQYGDSLENIDGNWKYAVVDLEKRIIKQCAVGESSEGVVFKIAGNTGGGFEPVGEPQEAAFEAYVIQRRAPGTQTTIINSAADLLKLDFGVFVNPQIINVDGTLVADPTKRPVDDAINAYIADFTSNDFNGVFRITKLVDKIQGVVGVVDVDPRGVKFKYGAFEYQSVNVAYTPNAGYVAIDEDDYPLDDTGVIEYIIA